MGLFKKVKRSLGHQDESLKDRGTKGTCKVLAAEASHWETGDDFHGTPLFYKTTIEVTLPGRPPYQMECHLKGGAHVGSEWPIYVDPADDQNVFVDWQSAVYGRIANALTPWTGGKAVAPNEQSIMQVATQIREQTEHAAATGTSPLPAAAFAVPTGVASAAPAFGAAAIPSNLREMMEQNVKTALATIKDPAQRKMVIEQYRAAGIQVDDPTAT